VAERRSTGKGRRSSASAKRGAAGRTRGGGIEAKTVAEFRDALRKNLIRPRDMVLLTRERIETVLGEAVERGQITARDAQGLGSNLLKRGRKETNDVLKDLEQLVGRGREEIEDASAGVRRRARGAARRAGVGSSFPISGYDDLTAAQVRSRLSDLTPAQLRKVRDYERRNANRKTVLSAIESKLS
jgi:hypothetical protein